MRPILAVLILATAVCGQGYRLTADAIRVDRSEHWREWIFQNDVVRTLNERADSTGLFLLSDDGVQPRLVAQVANAALAAGQFSYLDAVRTDGKTVRGGATALSNDRIAARLIDGDLDTFWEPAAADFSAEGLRNWELLVDLGRLAFVDSITVSFPAGDAPKAFSLLVSLGEPFPFPDGNSLSFSLVAETKATDLAPPGSDGLVRQSYPIVPLLRADFNLDGQPDLRGSFLQYIRLKITESDLERHRFVGEGDAGFGTYQALSPERRGAVVHQRLTAGGFLIEIDEDTYFEVVEIGGTEERSEVSKEAYDALALQWAAWEYWQTLPASQQHVSREDDDADGSTDEDPIDFIDNDGDGLIDEDGSKLRRAPRSSFAKDGELAFVGWSEWSENYQPTDDRTEAAITSPSPRKFVQIRFKISSEDPFKTSKIRSFHIDLAPPLALELAGELALLSPQGMARPTGDLSAEPGDYAPPRGINPLAPQHFSYFTRLAAPDPDDPTVRDGVNEILIIAPQAAEPLGVRIGRVQVERQASYFDPAVFSTRVLKTRFDRVFTPGPDGRLQDADGQTIAILPTGPDSLYLRFPASLNADLSPNAHALVEVQFASRTFREGVLFPAFARSSTDLAGFFQRVDAEAQDATELVASGTARVSLQTVGRQLINDVQVAGVFTPNGDGINDLLQGRFVLLRVLAERRLDIAFYDLAGALQGRAGSDLGQAGQWNFAWDGRDEHGQLVPPGIYLCRIKIAADRGAEEAIFPVHIAY